MPEIGTEKKGARPASGPAVALAPREEGIARAGVLVLTGPTCLALPDVVIHPSKNGTPSES